MMFAFKLPQALHCQRVNRDTSLACHTVAHTASSGTGTLPLPVAEQWPAGNYSESG